MAQRSTSSLQQSNAYNIFILVLTIISLVIMVVMFLPLDNATLGLLRLYDNLICVIFLVDFVLSLRAAPKKSDYFVKERGWLDLLGSIPSLGVAKYSGIFRLARLSRFARGLRILRRQDKDALAKDILEHRSQYTGLITILLTIIILATASVLVLQFESQSPEASITTGGDAFWYSIVTITTVGYGDYYPITPGGRITATFIMLAGVGVIGVLASLLSSLLVGSLPAPAEEEGTVAALPPAVEQELAAIRSELMGLRQLIQKEASQNDAEELPTLR
jgi:voltage-gated potassium channel